MKWEAVRELHPNQYVKLKILDSHIKGNKKIVTDVAFIEVIDNPKKATKELLLAKSDIVVYHTDTKEVVIEMRNRKAFSE